MRRYAFTPRRKAALKKAQAASRAKKGRSKPTGKQQARRAAVAGAVGAGIITAGVAGYAYSGSRQGQVGKYKPRAATPTLRHRGTRAKPPARGGFISSTPHNITGAPRNGAAIRPIPAVKPIVGHKVYTSSASDWMRDLTNPKKVWEF